MSLWIRVSTKCGKCINVKVDEYMSPISIMAFLPIWPNSSLGGFCNPAVRRVTFLHSYKCLCFSVSVTGNANVCSFRFGPLNVSAIGSFSSPLLPLACSCGACTRITFPTSTWPPCFSFPLYKLLFCEAASRLR